MAKKKYDDPLDEFMNSSRDKKEEERKRNLILLGSGSAVVLAAVGVGTFLVINNDKDATPEPSPTSSAYMKKGDSTNTNQDEPNLSEDINLAEQNEVDDKPEWLTKFSEKNPPIRFEGDTWATQADKDVMETVVKDARSDTIDLYAASNMLPSEKAGFTSDDSKSVDETGFPNPMYSYWTQEQFIFDTTMILEMFTDPDVGEWGQYQLAGSDPSKNYKAVNLNPILSSSLKSKIQKDGANQGNIGLLLDWKNDQYGMAGQFPNFGYIWYGKVNGTDTEMKYNASTSSYDVKLTVDVTYSAMLKDGNVIEKQGTLVLDLVSGQKEQSDSTRKILVDNASLTMEE